MSGPTYAQLKRRWETVRGARLRDLEAKFHRRRRRPSGPAIVAALEDMLTQTGDKRFGSAIKAVRKHELDRQDAGTWKRPHAAHADEVYVRRMLLLTNVKRLTVRNAAAHVAIEYWIASKTFDAVVKRLERTYRRLTKEVG